jgi:phospho-N-acetylmuramoyl-pentapeptide-transferase
MVTLDQFTHKTTITLLLSLLSFCVAMLLTPVYTYFAYKYKWWKTTRTHDTTGQELKVISALRIKRTIPRMAGMVTIVAIAAVTLSLNLNRGQTWLPLAALIGGGVLGLIDDIVNISGRGGQVAGLRAPLKFALITLVAALGAWFFYYKLGYNSVYIPFAGDFTIGWWLIPLFILVVVSTGNAVNITDGVDGLAGGLLAISYSAFGAIALFQQNYGIAGFCLTVVGALVSYLWFNIAPARFVMGDVGSFALGTALGVVAMLTNTLLLLPVIGLVFVVEAGSSLLQILSKKILHRKIFTAAPIHHHIEAGGWPKTKITMRFWLLGEMFAVLCLIIAFLGGYV